MNSVVLFLVNGTPESAAGIRAREFARRLRQDFQIHIAYRSQHKVRSILRFLGQICRLRPSVCYVLDMSYSGVVAAALYHAVTRCRVLTDTGDVISELARSSGNRGRIGQWLTKLLEELSVRTSDWLVVRSQFHQEWLAGRGIDCDVIQDAVDTSQFHLREGDSSRERHGLEGVITIGIVGSLIWSQRLEMCYGWELVELIRILREYPIKGVIVGDGTGVRHLQRRCREYNIEDRVLFLGRLPYGELPEALGLMDICLSTQTNDLAGNVRTTGKLPLYLACGRFVLASEVGEAARVLPKPMLVPYNGTKDEEYPYRLANRVVELLKQPGHLRESQVSVRIAKDRFEYSVLAPRLAKIIRNTLETGTSNAGRQVCLPVDPRD